MIGALFVALTLQDAAARLAELAPELEAPEPDRVYRAIERLAGLGSPVVPLLEARAKDAPAAAKPYLLLAAAEARRAADLPDGGRLRRFTVSYAPQDLGVLLSDFQRRTGAKFLLEGAGGDELPDVGVEIKDATFIDALLSIARAAKMVPRHDGGSFYLDPSLADPPAFAYGGVLVRMESFTQRRIVDFRRPARSRITLEFETLWDPSLKVVGAAPPVVLEAGDDQGRKLTVVPSEDVEGEAGDASFGQIELESAGGTIGKISILRGELPLRLERRSTTIPLGKPVEGASAKAEGLEVRVVRVDVKQAQIELELASAGHSPEELRKLPISVAGRDPAGQRLAAYVYPPTGDGKPRFKVVFGLAQRGQAGFVVPNELAAEKVEVSVTVDSVERRLPFEFRDLKLR